VVRLGRACGVSKSKANSGDPLRRQYVHVNDTPWVDTIKCVCVQKMNRDAYVCAKNEENISAKKHCLEMMTHTRLVYNFGHHDLVLSQPTALIRS
jgi:hypothetical protein